MKKSYLSLAILAFAALSAPTQAQTVLTVSSWLPPTHTASMAQKEWCDLLENNTKGRIKCNILPRGVSPAPGTYDAVKNGLADLSYTVHGYTPGRFVHTQMTELPFLGNSAESISVALSRVTGKHPEFAAEHQGVKVLSLFTHGPGIVFNVKRPIVKVEDLTGLKFRVGGGMVNDMAKALNMNATLKPAPDSVVAQELAALAGGASVLMKRALEVASNDLRLACHLADLAGWAAPEDGAIHANRAAIYDMRRRAEVSLMSKGIFKAAARESEEVVKRNSQE